jgi:hypothetical protein
MPNYMLLLHGDPTSYANLSPEEAQKALQKFVAWREKLRAQKLLVGSAKLRDEAGKVVRGAGKPRVTDGPYTETKEVFGGYFTITAPNYDAAIAACSDCPHLEYAGAIEVREVEPMPGTDVPH